MKTKPHKTGAIHAKPEQFKELAFLTIKNSTSIYQTSLLLAKQENWGLATSLQILALEESIKAFLFATEALGYNVRNTTDNFFSKALKGHDVKLEFSKLIFHCVHHAKEYFELLNNPKSVRETKMQAFDQELDKNHTEWFDKADYLKKYGFYTSFNNGEYYTPQKIRQQDFIESTKYVYFLISGVGSLISTMKEEDSKAIFESFATTLKELHKNKPIVVQN